MKKMTVPSARDLVAKARKTKAEQDARLAEIAEAERIVAEEEARIAAEERAEAVAEAMAAYADAAKSFERQRDAAIASLVEYGGHAKAAMVAEGDLGACLQRIAELVGNDSANHPEPPTSVHQALANLRATDGEAYQNLKDMRL